MEYEKMEVGDNGRDVVVVGSGREWPLYRIC